MPDAPNPKPVWRHTLSRLIIIFATILVIASAAYLLLGLLDHASEIGPGEAITLTLLLTLPFLLGAYATFILDPHGRRSKENGYLRAMLIVMAAFMLGGLIFREGLICLLMAGILWMPMIMLGAFTVKRIQKGYLDKSRPLETSLIAVIPAMLLGADLVIPQQISTYEVQRSITINADADDIWPLLLSLPDISSNEGRFTTAQSIVRIPRPRSAVVTGQGIGAIRHAQWGDNITFEEHITQWAENETLSWAFVFPNDSISRYTDRHISPDGAHLRILEGGYRLAPIAEGRTRLILHTRYEAETPLNAYAALWGEFFLGGIQVNILDIIDTRVEGQNKSL